MGVLQDEMHRVIAELRTDEALMTEVFRRVFKNRGSPLLEEQSVPFVRSLLKGETSVEITSEGADQTIVITEEEIDLALRELGVSWDSKIENAIARVVEDLSPQILGALYDSLPQAIQGWHEEQIAFQKKLYDQWKVGLDRLDMLVTIAHEAGEIYISDLNSELTERELPLDPLLEVLNGLHCRACRTAREVVCLLKAGHSDGAHARWRSLHEVAVIALFLLEHRGDTPQRYLDHAAVESFRAATQYQQHCKTLGYDPFSEDELLDLKTTSDIAIAKYGVTFKEDYGWAADALQINRPNFAQIESSLDMSHWRPWYRLACQSVHAGSKGLRFSLGIPSNSEDMLLAGASNLGLADPGHQTAISLTIACIAFLTARPNLDGLIACHCMLKVCDDIGCELLRIHQSMEE